MPRPFPHTFPEGTAVFPYDGDIRDSIHRFKYHGRAEYAAFYADCMIRIAGKEIRAFRPDVLIPVPIHASRLRERGYNQAEELAKHLSRHLAIPMDAHAMRRMRKTHPQNALSPEERKRNVRGAFALRSGGRLPRRVLLVDDIYTTGATADACRKALLEGGAKNVYLLTLASGRNQ